MNFESDFVQRDFWGFELDTNHGTETPGGGGGVRV